MTATSAGTRLLFIAANPSIDRFMEVSAITPGAIHRPTFALAVPGGKGLNAARAALSLGGDVTAVGIVGGRAGDWISEQLMALGMRASLVQNEAGHETRTCLSVLDQSTGRLTEFYEAGEAIGTTAWARLEDAVERELASGDVGAIICSGSLLVGAPTDGYARLIRMGQARSVPTVVDAHGPELLAALAASPTVVKVNAAEAAEATGTSSADPLGAARALIGMGAAWAIVTLGPDGAIACDAQAAWRLRLSLAPGLYPVGSGDAFVAGLALAIVRGASLQDAARLGMAAGAANAQVPGAGVLEAGAIPDLLNAVEVSAAS
ncbi:MAG: hexose kinase [Chloroflexota bacterium]